MSRWTVAAFIAWAVYGALTAWLGNMEDYAAYTGMGDRPYVYSERVRWVFAPLAAPGGFWAWVAVVTASGMYVMRRVVRAIPRYPVAGVAATVFTGIALISLFRCLNVAGLLAVLCLSPMGSVLAMCVKPYLCVFVVLHAAIICYERQPDQVSALEVQPAVSGGSSGDSGGGES
jgi:hypothetical protein